jgi:hypothetical protein
LSIQFDHLDLAVIDKAAEQIRTTGTATELSYLTAENGRYAARILYHVMEDGTDPEFHLEVRNKSLNGSPECSWVITILGGSLIDLGAWR